MIPQKLSLKNFLSYQQLTLDFAGLHTACICGANGAGKSSLLEAMTWAIWGKSRADTEDDIIHIGAKEAQVDFVFITHGETYRIIRTRPKGSAGSLEFQIHSEGQWRSLTERGLRMTQQVIVSHLKMDYDTFVNSAYLRQGRADEFMLQRPSDRKQILADMLNLSQYDHLAESAKDITRSCKGEATALENALANMRQQIAEGEAIAPQLEQLTATLETLRTGDSQDREQLSILENQWQQYQHLRSQIQAKQQQQAQLQAELRRIQQQQVNQQQQLQTLAVLLQNADVICQDHAAYQELHNQETILNQKLQQYQKLNTQRSTLHTQLASKHSELKGQLRHYQAHLESLGNQQQELQTILSKQAEIAAAIAQLQQARTNLQQIDHLQTQSAPLMQRRQILQHRLDQEALKLNAKLDEWQRSRQQLISKGEAQTQLLEAAKSLDWQILMLEKKQVYQQRVHDKGLERRDFLERLKTRAIDCEEKFNQIHAKLEQLNFSAQPNSPSYPPCPLCDRPLDAEHLKLVRQKHQQEHKELQAEMWLLKEQQAASECEIQVLREEYRQLMIELKQLPHLLEQKGNLQAQLQSSQDANLRVSQLDQEMTMLADRLTTQDFCREVQEELQLLDRSITNLSYDEKNHALARGEVERWRWAEIKNAELKNAQKQDENLVAKIPDLQAKIQQLADRLEQNLIDLELQQRLEQCDRNLVQLAYDPEQHQHLRQKITKAQPILLRYQELTLAQQQYPAMQQQYQQTQELQSDRQTELQILTTEIINLGNQQSALMGQQLESIQRSAVSGQLGEEKAESRKLIADSSLKAESFGKNLETQISNLKSQIQQQRSQMDRLIWQIGSLQQSQQQLEKLVEQEQATVQQLEQVRYRQRLHQELQQAFGKNGIQALMIETVLPQIEAEANQILAQLSDHQLNVRFITQKARKGSKGEVRNSALIETLEIAIADHRGTRPYETYSGGEAFRINFAIRLALSRVLAQRMGSNLQTLIIDEGFGTQDREGCDRLVAAINAIAPNFECILVITHMPQLKEAFTTLIEITKNDTGSQVHLVA